MVDLIKEQHSTSHWLCNHQIYIEELIALKQHCGHYANIRCVHVMHA